MKVLGLIALLVSFNINAQTHIKAHYVSNHDGDTITVVLPDSPTPTKKIVLRLVGIDATEIVGRGSKKIIQPFSLEARDELFKVCEDADITYTTYMVDIYNRPVVELWCNNLNVNQYLLATGSAFVVPRYAKKYTPEYLDIAQKAMDEELGVYKLNIYSPPECRQDINKCGYK